MLLLPRIPIWQAPTGSIAGPELCAAVSQAGGIGGMGLTWTSPEDATRKVVEVLQRTDKPFQVNFVLRFEPSSLVAALEAGVPVVTFSWGFPIDPLRLVRSFGASIGIQVTSRGEVRHALDLGADFLICQGVEAGGHVQAMRSLWVELPEVLEEAKGVPVIAAGGIGDANAIAKALAAGVDGAMLGTRFVATEESLAHPIYKQRIVERDNADLTLCFDGGWPGAKHRVLRNRTLDEWESAGCPEPGRRPGEGEVIAIKDEEPILRYEDTAPRIGMKGRIEEMCLYAGQSCADVHDIPKAGDLVDRLWRDVLAMKSSREPPQ